MTLPGELSLHFLAVLPKLKIIAALNKSFLLSADYETIMSTKLQIRPKKSGWSNHTAQGSEKSKMLHDL